jgi:hypothetical protein
MRDKIAYGYTVIRANMGRAGGEVEKFKQVSSIKPPTHT